MVFVQHLLCTVQVEVIHRQLSPRQTDERLQVRQLYVPVWALRVQLVEFLCFFVEGALNVLRPFLVHCLLQQVTFLG